jgi:hypothetical protein
VGREDSPALREIQLEQSGQWAGTAPSCWSRVAGRAGPTGSAPRDPGDGANGAELDAMLTNAHELAPPTKSAVCAATFDGVRKINAIRRSRPQSIIFVGDTTDSAISMYVDMRTDLSTKAQYFNRRVIILL